MAAGHPGETTGGAHDLVERALAGDKTALGRLLSLAERGGPAFEALHDRLHGRTGRALRVGFTGPPGAGKSTLVEGYALGRRARGDSIAVVAVDPTSPFTGGALLGDRVRMNRIAMDPGCFLRSMASRGSLGGLARTTGEVADVFDAAGYDRILVETVGVGQSEVDVAAAADVTVVVTVPGAGDGVQALKAGLMEIADVFVVNKADRPGADRAVGDLEEVLQFRPPERPRPPIVQTVAVNGEGLEALELAVDEVAERARASGTLVAHRRARFTTQVRHIVEDFLRSELFEGRGLQGRIAEEIAKDPDRPPYRIARLLLAEAGLGGGGASGRSA